MSKDGEKVNMKLAHISIQTGNIEKEISFFEKYAGLKIIEEFKTPSGRMVFMGDEESSTGLEIMENEEFDKITAKGLTLGFSSDSLEEVRKALLEAGFKPGEIRTPNERVSFFFVKSPTGVNVQFVK